MNIPVQKSRQKPSSSRRRNGHASNGTIDELVINGSAHIPHWVIDHESFRRWARSNAFPERGQFFYLDGTFWVDLSMETLIHNQIKNAILIVLGSIVTNEALGRVLGDRMMLTHPGAGLSCEPDLMFIANASLHDGAVILREGNTSLEVEGSPDMALEVVSKSSVQKDTVAFKELYARAAIAEYWIVDSTAEKPELVIYRLTDGKYLTVRRQDGWVKSKVFGRSFRLTSRKDAQGMSQFELEIKA